MWEDADVVNEFPGQCAVCGITLLEREGIYAEGTLVCSARCMRYHEMATW
jgi:hypothetical protein